MPPTLPNDRPMPILAARFPSGAVFYFSQSAPMFSSAPPPVALQTHRTKPSQIPTAQHPRTARDQEAGKILDADRQILAAQQDGVADHADGRAQHAGQEAAAVAVAQVTRDAVDEAAPGKDGDGEVLALLDAVVEAETQDDGQEDAEAVQHGQTHDLDDAVQPGLGVPDGHHELGAGVLPVAAGVGLGQLGAAAHHGLFLGGQEPGGRVGGRDGEEAGDGDQHRRDPFDDVQPAPSGVGRHPVHVQDAERDEPAERGSHGGGDEEVGDP